MSATGTGMGVLILLLCAWILVLICIQTYDFLKCRAHLSELQFIMDHLDEKYLFTECIPKAGNLYERYLFILTKRAGRSMIRAVSDAKTHTRCTPQTASIASGKSSFENAGQFMRRNTDPVIRNGYCNL